MPIRAGSAATRSTSSRPPSGLHRGAPGQPRHDSPLRVVDTLRTLSRIRKEHEVLLRAVNTGLLPERRPNTAALQEHRQPWTSEQLRGVVTSNCVGTSAWKSTMRDLDQFSSRFAGLVAADDVDIASSTASGKGGNGGRADPPKLQPLQRVNLIYSVCPIPEDSVLLKYMRALSALQGVILRRQQANAGSPADIALLQRVLKLMTSNEVLNIETRGAADVKALFRTTFIDRVANVIRAEDNALAAKQQPPRGGGPSRAGIPSPVPSSASSSTFGSGGVGSVSGSKSAEAVPFLDVYAAFDCATDGFIPAKPFDAALTFIDSPTTAHFIRFFFITCHTFAAGIHIAEMRTALQLIQEIAYTGGDLRATSMKVLQASSAASFAGLRGKLDTEFRLLCDTVFPVNGGCSRDRQLVDQTRWSDLRSVISNDSAFEHLAAMIAENSLY